MIGTWVDFFIHSPTQGNTHWTPTEWNVSGEALPKEIGWKCPQHSRKLRKILRKRLLPLTPYYTPSVVHRPAASAAPGSLLEMPNFRALLKPSWIRICMLTRAQNIHGKIRNWEAFTFPSQSWTPTLCSLNQVQTVAKPALIVIPDHYPVFFPISGLHIWLSALSANSRSSNLNPSSHKGLNPSSHKGTKKGPCYLSNACHLCMWISDSPKDTFWDFHPCNVVQFSQNAYLEKVTT